MQPLVLVIAIALLIWGIAQRVDWRPEARSVRPAAPQPRVKAAARPAPAKVRTATAPARPSPAPAGIASAPAVPLDLPRLESVPTLAAPQDDSAMRSRMRDRYIAARFPGTVASSASLADIEGVITTARLFFEEDRYDDALELLQLAIEQAPAPLLLELQRLEITYLRRDADRFAVLARQYQNTYPDSREWNDVARLGRALIPGEPLFTSRAGAPERHDHYGPWPNTPNWIHASWDLTHEVLASEFHQAMRKQREKGVAA